MKYEYTHFIPENIAPKGAARIVVKNGDTEVCSIPAARFGGLTPPEGEPKYSFGLVSDPHITPTGQLKSQRLEAALRFFSKRPDCAFVCDCGDSTNAGFTNGATAVDVSQFEEYKRICDLFSPMPVYNIAGNHDHYNAQLTGKGANTYPDPTIAVDTTLPDGTVYPAGTTLLTLYAHYTGHGIAYEVTQEDDVFLFVGQSVNTIPMSEDDLAWLTGKLTEYKERRCFVFVHSFLDDSWKEVKDDPVQTEANKQAEKSDGWDVADSGNPCDARNNSVFGYWENYLPARLTTFLTALKSHGRVILFHGHSHMMFEAQELDPRANYTNKNGFHSVHVPSVGNPRRLTAEDGTWTDDPAKATVAPQAYLVDVYEDCICLRGLSFADGIGRPVAAGTYRIEA